MPNLRLLRAVVIGVGDPPAQGVGLHAKLGGTDVWTSRDLTLDGKPAGFLAVAAVDLAAAPERDDDARVHVPEDERRSAELALESIARLLALDHRTTHRISSPLPCVGFDGEDARLLELEDARVAVGGFAAVLGGSGKAGILQDRDLLRHLGRRLDGVALLAEALNNGTPLGRYYQLLRLFERAFRLGPFALIDPLAAFLSDSKHGFTVDEVGQWTEARGPAVHADRRDEFLLDSDVQPFTPRMVEAGYDVLLNKAEWRTPSPERDEVWAPTSGSSGGTGIFVTHGADAAVTAQIADAFSAYPLFLGGSFAEVLPPGLWVSNADGGPVLRRMGGQASTA